MPRCSAVAVASVALLLAACDETAIVVELRSSRLAAPAQLDAACLSAAATDGAGDEGTFARRYPLDSLPQTLTLLPGGHEAVQLWARGTLGGVEVARAGVRAAFQDGAVTRVGLELSCVAAGGAAQPAVAGTAPGLAEARVAVALGWRAPVVVVVAPGAAGRYGARRGGGLTALPGGLPEAPGAGVAALYAFDADGDCDDDLLVAPPDVPPQLWRQDGDGAFVADADALPDVGVVAAAAAADVDGDHDLDLAVGGGAALRLLRNDGTGRFQEDAAAMPAGAVGDVTALAFGDVTGDGHPDLAVGQGSAAGAAPRLLASDAAGMGFFAVAPGALPELPGRTRGLAFADADGDGDTDLFLAGLGAPVRLYVNRGDGRLEDRSFIRLPSVDLLDATGLAAADLDGDCLVDVAIALAGDGAVITWRGTDAGAFVDAPLAAGTAGAALALDDADGDGGRDLITAGAEGVTWVAPR